MAAKRPSFQFYSADWLKDPAVRSVSLAARGLWADMLCLMDQSPRRGFLQHASGKPVTAEQLARMTGCSTDEASRLLQELSDSEVYSSSDTGVVFSRRMVRDERKRELCQQAGRLGGNPTLKGTPKGGSKGGVKGTAKRNPTPSSSSSSSTSVLNQSPPSAGGDFADLIPEELNNSDFSATWKRWVAFRSERKPKVTQIAAMQQLGDLAKWEAKHGTGTAVKCLEDSIRNSWQGVFEPKVQNATNQPTNKYPGGTGANQSSQPSSRVAVPAGALDKFRVPAQVTAGSAGGNNSGSSQSSPVG